MNKQMNEKEKILKGLIKRLKIPLEERTATLQQYVVYIPRNTSIDQLNSLLIFITKINGRVFAEYDEANSKEITGNIYKNKTFRNLNQIPAEY
jgi:hypothetical protein